MKNLIISHEPLSHYLYTFFIIYRSWTTKQKVRNILKNMNTKTQNQIAFQSRKWKISHPNSTTSNIYFSRHRKRISQTEIVNTIKQPKTKPNVIEIRRSRAKICRFFPPKPWSASIRKWCNVSTRILMEIEIFFRHVQIAMDAIAVNISFGAIANVVSEFFG